MGWVGALICMGVWPMFGGVGACPKGFKRLGGLSASYDLATPRSVHTHEAKVAL